MTSSTSRTRPGATARSHNIQPMAMPCQHDDALTTRIIWMQMIQKQNPVLAHAPVGTYRDIMRGCDRLPIATADTVKQVLRTSHDASCSHKNCYPLLFVKLAHILVEEGGELRDVGAGGWRDVAGRRLGMDGARRCHISICTINARTYSFYDRSLRSAGGQMILWRARRNCLLENDIARSVSRREEFLLILGGILVVHVVFDGILATLLASNESENDPIDDSPRSISAKRVSTLSSSLLSSPRCSASRAPPLSR